MFDDKLTHARRLIEQRDQIDQELRVLFGEASATETMAGDETRKTTGRRPASSKTARLHQTRKSEPDRFSFRLGAAP